MKGGLEQYEVPRYATLLYDVRQTLGISWSEYVLLDMIYHLGYKTGYCYKSPAGIAQDLGFTKRGTNKMINRLAGLGLLERLTDYTLRVTDTYVALQRSGNAVPDGGNSVPTTEVSKWEQSSRSGNSVPQSGNSVPKKQGTRITIEYINNIAVKNAFQDFIAMRKTMRKPLTPRAAELVFKKLTKLYPDNPDLQLACLNQSIEHCWQTVYELKDDNGSQKRDHTVQDDFDELNRKLGNGAAAA